jgi:hypothetical protein
MYGHTGQVLNDQSKGPLLHLRWLKTGTVTNAKEGEIDISQVYKSMLVALQKYAA